MQGVGIIKLDVIADNFVQKNELPRPQRSEHYGGLYMKWEDGSHAELSVTKTDNVLVYALDGILADTSLSLRYRKEVHKEQFVSCGTTGELRSKGVRLDNHDFWFITKAKVYV